MATTKYTIKALSDIKAPAYRVYDQIEGSNYFLVTSSTIKHYLRKHLYEVFKEGPLATELEDELFGYVDRDRGVKRSNLQISPAKIVLPKVFVEKIDSKLNTLPAKCCLQGEIKSDLPAKSKENLALRMILLTMDRMGQDTEANYGIIKLTTRKSRIIRNQRNRSITAIGDQKDAAVIPKVTSHYCSNVDSILQIMSPRNFEKLIACIYSKLGFNVHLTKSSCDNGFDVIATRTSRTLGVEKYLIQCKRYMAGRKVGIAVVREMMGILDIEKATKVIIVTNCGFSAPSMRLLARYPSQLHLMNGDTIEAVLHS